MSSADDFYVKGVQPDLDILIDHFNFVLRGRPALSSEIMLNTVISCPHCEKPSAINHWKFDKVWCGSCDDYHLIMLCPKCEWYWEQHMDSGTKFEVVPEGVGDDE